MSVLEPKPWATGGSSSRSTQGQRMQRASASASQPSLEDLGVYQDRELERRDFTSQMPPAPRQPASRQPSGRCNSSDGGYHPTYGSRHHSSDGNYVPLGAHAGDRRSSDVGMGGRKSSRELRSEGAVGKRAKATPEAALSAALASRSSFSGLASVKGLADLMRIQLDSICSAALAWCEDNQVHDVQLICEAKAEEEFIAALPIKPTSIPAKVLRGRLAGLAAA